jgi:hypothetical protein
VKTYTKETIIAALQEIKDKGWVKNQRPNNDGGVGNTLEDLLGIEENNLPIPNAAEWELKAQRADTKSLTTLFHMEPSPTAFKFVPQVLLPQYGWPHQNAGIKYPSNEMSFRQTINALSPSDRGFKVVLDKVERKVIISFNSISISNRHALWKSEIERKVGLSELAPQPYWGFDDLFYKLGSKLHNCFYVKALRKKDGGVEYFHYNEILILKTLSQNNFISAIESGHIYVDFDARTGHNHGTKFRIKQAVIPSLYDEVTKL